MEILKIILTSLLSAFTLFIIAKVRGHKEMAQLGFLTILLELSEFIVLCRQEGYFNLNDIQLSFGLSPSL